MARLTVDGSLIGSVRAASAELGEPAHFEGRYRMSARACIRFESTALLVVLAVWLSERAKPWSFPSSPGFRCEPLSALSIAFRRAAIWSAGSACDRSN